MDGSQLGLWEARYRAGDMPWDRGEVAPPLRAYLAKHRMPGRVLVPGCGRGHEARYLAEQKGEGEVVGLDIAPSAVELAARLAAGVPRVRWLVGDFQIPPLAELRAFDWIVEHTCFCALPPEERPAYVQAAAQWLKPGGYLWGIFYLRTPRREDGLAGPPFGADRAEIMDRFSEAFDWVADWLPSEAFPSRRGRERVFLWRRSDVSF